jgi:hypothetical protein
VDSGTLRLVNATALGPWSAANASVATNATLEFSLPMGTFAKALRFSAGATLLASEDATISGQIDLLGVCSFNIPLMGKSLTITGRIANIGTFTKNGDGPLRLAGPVDNTFGSNRRRDPERRRASPRAGRRKRQPCRVANRRDDRGRALDVLERERSTLGGRHERHRLAASVNVSHSVGSFRGARAPEARSFTDPRGRDTIGTRSQRPNERSNWRSNGRSSRRSNWRYCARSSMLNPQPDVVVRSMR